MDDLVAFITARLNEDDATARAANPSPWRRFADKAHLDPNTIFGGSYPGDQDKLRNVCSIDLSWERDANAEHIMRHDPARILREVQAKRRILEWAQDRLHDAEDFPDDQEYRLNAVEVLRLHLPWLALPYSDHVDFLPVWLIEENSTDG